ncbi:MAG: STAS domain-containing protein, partial [Acidobacteria bacterium]|nr:STAS domain-containing protein [Acidobacteriota bacterium]
MRLKISNRLVDGAVVVDLYGHIVFGDESSALRRQVHDLIPPGSNVVLNFSNVNMLDSSGVGTLVGLLATVRKSGGDLKLAGLPPRVRDVLGMTRLLTLFEI